MHWNRNSQLLLMVFLGLVFVLEPRQSSAVFAESSPAPISATRSSEQTQSVLEQSNPDWAQLDSGTLVRMIDTSLFSPAIPDPTGITYLASTSTLLVSDSEVDETPLFRNGNVFAVDLSGSLAYTLSTIPFSEEPTAIAIDPNSGHMFVADDNPIKVTAAYAGDGVDQIHPGPEVTVVDPGADQLYLTADDVITFLATETFGSSDPEGLAFDTDQKHLFVLDDTTHRIYELSPGANGIYDGLIPEGDDHVTSYDLSHLNMSQIKGVTYNSANHHLYLVGRPLRSIVETTITGLLVRRIDVSALNLVAPSDLVFAPSSLDSNTLNLYVTDRGVDNNVDPTENDGKIFEIALPAAAPSTNEPPTVDAGPSRTIYLPGHLALLDGTVTDDGLPSDPGTVQTTWSQLQGPSNVLFADATAVDTSVTVSDPGTYVLRLLADDGVATASDTVTVTLSATQTTATNLPPVVEAGSNRTIFLPERVALLDGTVTDDGLPASGTLETTWSQLQGPGSVIFSDTAAVDTGVTLPALGVYVLQLLANDGAATASDTVTVTLSPTQTNPPANTPPIIEVEPSQSARVGQVVTLSATVTDDGLPNPPGKVTSAWSLLSPSGGTIVGDATALTTEATFTEPGEYGLRLTATDGEFEVHRDVTITITEEIVEEQESLFLPITQK
ncbi:MAG: hypothetical protein IT328_06805 [Caldilineaceae bacterium]|nr:hypothetical protein [Caldilineaceae bacterium]